MPNQDEQTQRQSGGLSAHQQDQTDVPGRTPDQAEGTRETVEEDLGEKPEQARDRGSAGGPDQTYQAPGRTSQAEGTRETVEEDLREKTE